MIRIVKDCPHCLFIWIWTLSDMRCGILGQKIDPLSTETGSNPPDWCPLRKGRNNR